MKYKITIQVSSESTDDASRANPCEIVPASMEIVTPTAFSINTDNIPDGEKSMVIDAFRAATESLFYKALRRQEEESCPLS